MELRIKFHKMNVRLSTDVYVRLAMSQDANPSPRVHVFLLKPKDLVVVKWIQLTSGPTSLLVWEACVLERAPEEEGGELEPLIVGGTTTPLSGRHHVRLYDFYAESHELIAEFDIELSGLPQIDSVPELANISGILTQIQDRYERYYLTASPLHPKDKHMRVPTFTFYGSAVQASYLTLLQADMDDRFARSVLLIVLEEAGMTPDEFVSGIEQQFESHQQIYLQETTALVARIGEFSTFTANLIRYRADMSSPVIEAQRKLIERIVPHVREEHAGDCEDSALEIYFCFDALRRLEKSSDRIVAAASRLARAYVPFLATTVATAPSAGGVAQGELLHVFALALPLSEATKKLSISSASLPEWQASLPVLAPLEGTNWCEALHLPQDQFYGSMTSDVEALKESVNREVLAGKSSSRVRQFPTRIRQRLGVRVTEEQEFSTFYLRVTELWTADIGCCCCFSAVRHGKYAVGLGLIASKDSDYSLVTVFEHTKTELDVVRVALRTIAPIPAWKGTIKPFKIPQIEALSSRGMVPKRISRLHSDTLIFRFRSLNLASCAGTVRTLEKLLPQFKLAYRAWKLPPDGKQVYIAIYATQNKWMH